MKLKSVSKPRIIRYKWAMEVVPPGLASLSAVIGSVLIHFQLADANHRMQSSDGGSLSFLGLWFTWIAAIITVIFACIKGTIGYLESKSQERQESPADLYAACFMLRSSLLQLRPRNDDDSLRITMYRVSERGNKGSPLKLEQLIPYASKHAESGREGRVFSTSVGIIGKVVKEGEPLAAVRVESDGESFRKEMASKWGYTVEEAAELDDTRWSWMAVPLKDRKKRVAGVVFLDSTEADYFDSQRMEEVIEGCIALNELALERYP